METMQGKFDNGAPLQGEDLEAAMKHDQEIKEAVERNRQAAIKAGVALAQSDQEAQKMIERAQKLRAELAGYHTLSPELKANEGVRATVEPRLKEYIRLRFALAQRVLHQGLCGELGMTHDEIDAYAYDVPVAKTADPALSETPPTSPPPEGLHEAVLRLDAAQAHTVDVVGQLAMRLAILEAKFGTPRP